MASAEPAATLAQSASGDTDADADAAPGSTMAVQVVCGTAPRQLLSVALRLPVGSTALTALRASGLAAQLGATVLDKLALGLWGRLCLPGAVLQDGDRLELLRPLLADAMDSRRQRLQRDGRRKVSPRKRG